MDRYGLIGRPLGHSFSAELFNKKFEKEGIDACYTNHELADISEFPALLETVPQLRGLNVTSPYKLLVGQYVNIFTPEAQSVGNAVNTLKIVHTDGGPQIIGHNTDVDGFLQLLSKASYQGKTALILGSGGASAAVAAALRKLGNSYRIVSRNPRGEMVGYDQLTPSDIYRADLIVQATPLGMGEHIGEFPPIDYAELNPKTLCVDLVYNPTQTAFMDKCQKRGCRVANGLEMLLGQARSAWQFWQT